VCNAYLFLLSKFLSALFLTQYNDEPVVWISTSSENIFGGMNKRTSNIFFPVIIELNGSVNNFILWINLTTAPI
jgi:hypothetical protein